MHAYAAIAELYAADYQDTRDDIDFLVVLARHSPGPIVEYMSGTGRVLLPLARAGFTVTGVDTSLEMMAVAQQQCAQEPSLKITLTHGDVRDWHSDTQFGLAIIAVNSFMHLTDVDDQLKALHNIHRNLKPNGRLCIDVLNPDIRAIPNYSGKLTLMNRFTLPDGRSVQKFSAVTVDVSSQLMHVTFLYDINENNAIRRVETSFPMRWFWRYEIEHLLARAGFEIEQIYGDYELEEFTSESEQMLIVASKKA